MHLKEIKEIKETLVVGLGISGLAVAQYLHQNKIPFAVFDTREEPPKLEEFNRTCPGVPFYTKQAVEHFKALELYSLKTLILSPGLAKDDPSLKPLLSPHVKIIGDIELFAQNVKAPVVAITGSNGKSTVTTLVGEMAKQAGIRVGVGGNLGTSALTLLQENYDLYVLELSSFQLETTYSLKPAVSTVLNLCLDHMDRYKTLEEYYRAKAQIFNNSQAIVVNRDDTYVFEQIKKQIPSSIPAISFGLNLPPDKHFGVDFKVGGILMQGQTPLLPISDLKIFGMHNVANVLAALSLGASIQLPLPAMLSTLQTFTGLPHRGEWVRTRNEVQWINDSKGTNVGATMAAIQGLKQSIGGKWILIAGGIAKNADFSPLKPVIQESCRAVILLGEARKELKALLSDVNPSEVIPSDGIHGVETSSDTIVCIEVNSMEEAVRAAAKQALPGDGVLLSPACASFDMFKNFEHRGDVFKACVRALPE